VKHLLDALSAAHDALHEALSESEGTPAYELVDEALSRVDDARATVTPS
jgi:hypothetical protein